MFQAIGILFLVLGLLCGGAIVAAPLGLMHQPDGMAVYLLFPGLFMLGYLFLAGSVRDPAVAKITRGAGAALMLLAAAAAVILVIFATGIMVAEGSRLPLWYVMGLGIVFGSAALTVRGDQSKI
ncbi:hypothetical protein V8J88_06635 [Massilia sp. W12]|uniref:hypothetical protein n=1 Tax=Massilia sp. W12 TaxID=3126507 RepID=UPI0030CCAA73